MSPLHGPPDVLVVRRRYPVPRERVFAAWLDPATLEQFMCPGAVNGVRAEVEARVGGKYRIMMQKPDGDVEHRGEYLVIEPPSLLSFTWISASTEWRTTAVTVEFLERQGVIVHAAEHDAAAFGAEVDC